MFPDVPDVPGVPALPRAPGATTQVVQALTGDSQSVLNLTGGTPSWGVFDDGGSPVINADSFVSVEFDKDRRVSDYPQEQGAFASYNKVVIPFDARVIFNKGGSLSDRTAFLAELDAAADSLELYTLVTPEVTYANVNMERYNYARKSDKGVTLIAAECFFRQIRLTGASQFTQTATPDGATPVSGGTVQPQPPNPSQTPPQPWAT